MAPRSRRPKSSPTRIADLYEDEIVRIRKELTDAGYDAGAETIRFHMATPGRAVPSTSTIWRVLKARGFVTPQPHKRPKRPWTRFVADFPNECWQLDMTHVEVADGVVYEVLNIIDDHSRVCVASQVFVVVKAPDVVRTIHKAAGASGAIPQRVLTDNGPIFTTPLGGAMGAMESELIESRHRHEALEALSPPDLWQGRAFPSDDEEVPGRPGPRRDQEATGRPLRPLR